MLKAIRSLFLPALLAALALHQIVSAIRVLQLPETIRAQISLSPTLEIVAGFGWALAFGCCLGAVITRRGKAVQRAALITLALFTLYSFGRLWIFTRADYDRGRLLFLGLLTIVIILVLSVGMLRTRRINKSVAHSREDMNGRRRESND